MDNTAQTHIACLGNTHTVEHIRLRGMGCIIIILRRIAQQIQCIRRQQLYLVHIGCTTTLLFFRRGIIVESKDQWQVSGLTVLSRRGHRNISNDVIDVVSREQTAPSWCCGDSRTNSATIGKIIIGTAETAVANTLRGHRSQIVGCRLSCHTCEIGDQVTGSLIIVAYFKIHITEYHIHRNKAKTRQELLSSALPVRRANTYLCITRISQSRGAITCILL